MDLHHAAEIDSLWTRLRTLQSGGAAGASLLLSPRAVLAGVRMLLDWYPPRYRRDVMLQDRLLRAFVTAVLPGAAPDDPDLVRMYHDRDYPFHPYAPYLAWDLARRTRRLHGHEEFDRLTLEERTGVIQDALGADETTSRMVRGAILMANVSTFAGIYHPERGSPLIDFPGANRGYALEASSYPGAEWCFGGEITHDGNPP
jgi:hypothetical protein